MKKCPNPQCRHRQRHGVAAEYQDSATACSDCGGALESVVESPAPLAKAAQAVKQGQGPWPRLSVTLACAAACIAAAYLPLPGTEYLLRQLGNDPGSALLMSVGSLGVTPVLSGYMVVEFFAVLVPAWRPLRISGRPGRLVLRRWIIGLAGLFAFMQSVGLGMYLRDIGRGPGMSYMALPAWVPTAAVFILPVGTLFVVLLAAVNDRWGLGDGFSVVIVAAELPALANGFAALVRYAGETAPMKFILLGGVIAAVVWASAQALKRKAPFGQAEDPYAIETPPSGMAPWMVPASLLALPMSMGALFRVSMPDLRNLGFGYDLLQFALAASLAVGLGLLYNQPARVAAVWFGPTAQEPQRNAARRQITVAIARGLALVLGIELLRYAPNFFNFPLVVNLLVFVVATAVLLDLAGEWAFRCQHPELRGLWPVHRVYAVGPALEALTKAGVPAYPRGLHHRTLLQFFGPYVPVLLLVPAKDAERAETIVRERLVPGA